MTYSCQNILLLLGLKKKKKLNFVVLFEFIRFSILAKVLFAAETFLGPKGKHIPPLTIVQFLTIALSPSPSDSLNALNTHWGKLSKLSMRCSLVNRWPIQIRLNSKQTVASHCKRQPCNIKKLESTIYYNLLFSLETFKYAQSKVKICKYYTNVFLSHSSNYILTFQHLIAFRICFSSMFVSIIYVYSYTLQGAT